MNLQEFMHELKELKRRKGVRCFLANGHAIRLSIYGVRCCPIEAVAYERSGRLLNGYVHYAGRDLGLSQKDAQRIIDAADENYMWGLSMTESLLRKQMLKMVD